MLKTNSFILSIFISINSYAFDSSIIEYEKNQKETLKDGEVLLVSAEDEKLFKLSPGINISEFGVSHDVAVSKAFRLNEGKAGVLDFKIEFNSSTDTDEEAEVIKQLSFGGADSAFKATYLYSYKSFYLGAGVDVAGWEYNIKLDTGEIVNDESVLGNYSLYAHFKSDSKWYLGVKATYFDVLSDKNTNSIESEINDDYTINFRGLLPFEAPDGSVLWGQADLVIPLAGEDPIFSLGFVMNFNVL